MCRRFALVAVAMTAVAAGAGGAAAQRPPDPAPSTASPVPGQARPPSQATGAPWCGRLVGGVPLATGSSYFFTWDLTVEAGPNPSWRRYGTTRLINVLRRVTSAYHQANPNRPRVGIADLSLPHGGPFGARYGGLGHASHQNGLDADVLYPRRDGIEAAAIFPFDVDRAAAQDLADRFVAAGAQYVFVGQGLGLRGRPGVVQAIPHHLDHMHVRLSPLRPVKAPLRCPWHPD